VSQECRLVTSVLQQCGEGLYGLSFPCHIFPPEGAAPHKRDLTTVETHLLDTGHFALETHGEELASRIEKFFGNEVDDQGRGFPASRCWRPSRMRFFLKKTAYCLINVTDLDRKSGGAGYDRPAERPQ
jgi:hypothetical protein